MEVEQSLGAVDGCVVILDSSAGVEAQTMTVWSQSERHDLPKIIFANKMDRLDGDFEACIDDVRSKLNIVPIPLQVPCRDKNGHFKGIIDLLSMKKIIWDQKHQGMSYLVEDLNDTELATKIYEKRLEMIDTLSGYDDKLADTIIANESLENVSLEDILNALRRLTIERKIVPMLCGSAYKNAGVQLLMDAVINYLPAPHESEKNKIYNCFGNDFVGKVFKVTHDPQRGALSLVRIYRGELKKSSRITTSKGTIENVQRIYEPLADEYRETDSISAGNVCVCAGLKTTQTGNLLVANMSSLRSAQKKISKKFSEIEEEEGSDDLENDFSLEPKIPDAVFFCSIEPPSLSYQSALETALAQIQREDPSLRVKYDETTMQTVLGGMGELHLDIIKSRLLSEYKIDADLGPLQIAYKEAIEDAHRSSWKSEKEIAGSKQSVEIEMTLDVKHPTNEDIFRLDNSAEASECLKKIRPRYIYLVKKSAIAALERGPKIGGQIVDVRIKLHRLIIGRGTVDAFISAATYQCVQKIMLEANCRLMEPMMAIQIVVPSEKVSAILADSGRRRAQILEISLRGEQNKVIEMIAPLAELSGYSSVVRTMSSGTASLTMQPHGYSMLPPLDEATAIRRAQGLE